MPSGAKKRKAARKKKEKEEAFNNSNKNSTNNSSSANSSSNPQGNDDPRSQDERDSDGGEVGSPVLQDHRLQFNKGNEESEKTSLLSVRSFVAENKPLAGVYGDGGGSRKIGLDDDDDVKIERELNPKQDAESQDVTFEHVDSPKESHDGDDSSSSSSSRSSNSDNESQGSEQKWKEEACNSVLMSAATCNNEENTVSEEVTLPSENEKPVKEVDINSVVETEPVVLVSETLKHVVVGAQVENSEVVDVVESGQTENEDKSLPISDDVTSNSVVVPVKNEDKIFPIVDEKVGAPSEVVVSTVNGNEGKTLASSRIDTAETSRDAGNTNYSKTSEFTEDQPLIASAPRVTQRTSWTSCCGLFEVFTGSDR